MSKNRQFLHNFGQAQRLCYWLLLPIVLAGCGTEPVDDEARIRQRVADMVNATEAKELGEVMAPVAEEFLGNQRIRKTNLKGLVLLHFRRHKNLHVFVNDLEVILEAEQARVTCNVVLAGRNQTLPERARVLNLTSNWEKRDDDWFVVSAQWKDPLLDL
ncbi:MAG: hypothetical protein PVG75_05520 [Thioalkalispiraceae bacterium]|jgi:hypothetical protein